MLVPYVDEGRAETPLGPTLPTSMARIVVGGAAAIIFEQVRAGRAGELRALHPELLYFVLLPYVGHERAFAEVVATRDRRP